MEILEKNTLKNSYVQTFRTHVNAWHARAVRKRRQFAASATHTQHLVLSTFTGVNIKIRYRVKRRSEDAEGGEKEETSQRTLLMSEKCSGRQ